MTKGRPTIHVVAACLVLLILPAAGRGQPRSEIPARAQRTLEGWDREMTRIDALLVDGEPKKAYRRAETLLEEMAQRFISGPAVGRFLGLATVLRALAAYGLDREDEALWHWHVAHQLFPVVSELKLTAYGDAGPFLKSHPPRPEFKLSTAPLFVTGNVIPPQKLKAPKPEFPRAKRGGKRVSVVVQTIIGKDGAVRYPLILQSQGELTLVCATLDRLREWKFRPAELDGKPVPVFYNLTVDFIP